MATAKKAASKKTSGMSWKISWRRLIILASFALNIGFIVVIITMMATNVLDGLFIKEGVTRYCLPANDYQFGSFSAKVRAQRMYTCATDDAKQYYDQGLQQYLDAKGIKD